MRLLHAETLEFRIFDEHNLPKYIILSHTWGGDEVSYQDMCWLQKLQNMPTELKSNPLYALFLSAGGGAMLPSSQEAITERAGYAKIAQTARIALTMQCKYFWVDTCCIDKTSSAELQEAINSMYRWYRSSAFCAVFLADATPIPINMPLSQYFTGALRESRWITRGWTLQELIAPRYISFYDRDWSFICDKEEVIPALESVTGIPSNVLRGEGLTDESVAQRFSWAANRATTRVEDLAYSLMGLFDIHMPMLYGEGEKAFIRLQEEILKNNGDDSIFSWQAPDAGHSTFRGLLARSPSEFKKCGGIYRGNTPLAISKTNLGLHLQLNLRPFGKRDVAGSGKYRR
ncbi:HET-domain-containing protein [Melanomma pulvis-pyrius CBS 109.77]|uniref:HET-domain-containing protein n=1 Tax=Melanomma pulvis-pyrius CBS 109.77 TaxID=1314802 RepID=A0A6A6X910_9PLEO|nr:HET-domain-containing protein [Melanomma pulvis-pyrius CBS 109.77]